MTNDVFIFQEKAICLTKYGHYSNQIARHILDRKELERRSGQFDHAKRVLVGNGEKGTPASICYLVERYAAKTVLFTPIKNQKTLTPPAHVFVWRKYRTLTRNRIDDVPEHVLMTSSIDYSTYFALVCKSTDPIGPERIGKFSNRHYKNLKKNASRYELGSCDRGQRTTGPYSRVD